MRHYRQCKITEDNFTFLRTRRYRPLHYTCLFVSVQCVCLPVCVSAVCHHDILSAYFCLYEVEMGQETLSVFVKSKFRSSSVLCNACLFLSPLPQHSSCLLALFFLFPITPSHIHALSYLPSCFASESVFK
jgi:hypothetical protein